MPLHLKVSPSFALKGIREGTVGRQCGLKGEFFLKLRDSRAYLYAIRNEQWATLMIQERDRQKQTHIMAGAKPRNQPLVRTGPCHHSSWRAGRVQV